MVLNLHFVLPSHLLLSCLSENLLSRLQKGNGLRKESAWSGQKTPHRPQTQNAQNTTCKTTKLTKTPTRNFPPRQKNYVYCYYIKIYILIRFYSFQALADLRFTHGEGSGGDHTHQNNLPHCPMTAADNILEQAKLRAKRTLPMHILTLLISHIKRSL